MLVTNTIKRFAKKYHKAAGGRAYDKKHRDEALQAVSIIEELNSVKLSQKQKALADEYSVEILGSKYYAPWLYVYTLVRGEFKEGWIPDNFFGKFVAPKVNKGIGVVTEMKSFTNILLQTSALPDIAYYIDGIIYDRNMSTLSVDSLRTLVENKHNHIFIKSDFSCRGLGVARATKEDINEERLQKLGNCVIQKSVQQHAFFDRILSGSFSTLRITTAKEKDGTIDMRAAYLRLGRANTSWVQSSNSVRVAIISRSGDLDSFGYTPDWRRWSRHPDTNFSFENERIPLFTEAVAACVGFHKKIPHLSIIGWDVIISEDETINIIEWNTGHPDIKFSEATTGPCFIGLDWETLKN